MLEMLIKDFLIIWTTIDPFGTLALFVGLTAHMSREKQRQIARRGVMYAGIVLLASILLGQLILAGMGIKLISLQVAGSIILFVFALQMIFSRFPSGNNKEEEGYDIAVFPLAIPSIATPGAIMAVILLTDNNYFTLQQQLATSAVLVFVLGVTYVFLLFSENILKLIGHSGAKILVKVMGMLLAALSVELIMEAIGFERWMEAQP